MALPPPAQRPWLLEQLAVLLREHGHARWLQAPLVEDDSHDLEDLMRHASVGSLPPELAHAGIGGSMAALCVDVARAFRVQHGLVADDEGLEALLADLTAAYLGFGLQVLRPPLRQREVRGFLLQTKAPTALDTESIAFLVGAQLAARDPSERQLERLLGSLPPRRHRLVLEAMTWFHGEGRASLSALLHDDEPIGRVVQISGGRPVGRVSVSHGVAGVVAGALFGLALGLVGLAALGEARSLLLIPPLALLGGLVGWSLRGGRCSSCRAQIGDQDVLCPGCGGLVTD
ncbi:MAG TPA: hypothetical protein QGF58_09495 [Myxococcota bacterium]|nr:hypothetical protein [Myxococcota bacterium]